jgi:hypothetical protein
VLEQARHIGHRKQNPRGCRGHTPGT